MAVYTVKITQNGSPLVGAEVVAVGERLFATTDANGEVSASIGYSNPLAVNLVITSADGKMSFGGGPFRLAPGETRTVEVGG